MGKKISCPNCDNLMWDSSTQCLECRSKPRQLINNEDGTYKVPLPRGLFAIIDEEDYDLISQYNWQVSQARKGGVMYARNPRKIGWMHHLILSPPKGYVVDHINRNGLDNRRCNLRLATPSQNSANSKSDVPTISGYIGVREDTRNPRTIYTAQISHNRQTIYIGTYNTAEEAARAYDNEAVKLRGEFAVINFPKD